MTEALIQARLTAPLQVTSYLERPRLESLWDEWGEKRVVCVEAPAGAGKTTFLAARARSYSGRVAWLSLDDADVDPARLGVHLLAALGCSTEAPANPETLLTAILRELQDGNADRLLILDDLHLLGAAGQSLAWLGRLLRYLPPRCQLVLASRSKLPLPLTKLGTRGLLARLEPGRLAFTPEESEHLLAARFPGAALSSDVLRRIQELTEGWAAGLEIFCQACEAGDVERVTEKLTQSATLRGGWFDYFAEEVLAGLEPALRDFLLSSAVLPRLDADLCAEVLLRDDSPQRLAELVERNLFTFPAGNGHRYHHLFRDFLAERMVRSVAPDERHALYRRCARALEERGEWAEALAAATAAADHDRILGLLERRREDLLGSGRLGLIQAAVAALPASRARAAVGPRLVLAGVHEIQGRWEQAERDYRAALRREERPLRRVELLSHLAQLALRQGRYRRCLGLCERALAEPCRMALSARGRIHELRGVSACDLGRVSEGEAALLEAGKLFRRSGDARGEGRVLYLLAANVHAPRGAFRAARRAARHALALFRKLRDPQRTCHSLGVLGWVLVESGDLREGRELSLEALRMAAALEYRTMLGICRFTLGKAESLSGDTEAAAAHFEAARELGEQLGEAELRSVPYLGLARLALAGGNRALARRHARHALAVVSEYRDRLLIGRCHALLGEIDVRHRPTRAREHWRLAERALTRAEAHFDLHRLALMRCDLGDADAIGGLLEAIGSHEHEALLLVHERARGAALLAAAVARDVDRDYALALLERLGERAVPALAAAAEEADEPERERLVEALIRSGGAAAEAELQRIARSQRERASTRLAASEVARVRAPALVIAALGPLRVSCASGGQSLTRWSSRRALRLFQLLLTAGFRWMHQDRIVEALWPEGDPRRTRNNLRQSIFLLRRSLETLGGEGAGADYLQHRDESVRLRPGNGHRYDVDEFERLLEAVESHRREGESEAMGAALVAALELYGGDFLAESPYEEFAVLRREQLRDRFLRGLRRLVQLRAEGERWEGIPAHCRRGLAIDPFDEELHWQSLRAQVELGRRAEALAEYHRYEALMLRELDLPPAPRMQALAERATS